jgi:hypothetical protein
MSYLTHLSWVVTSHPRFVIWSSTLQISARTPIIMIHGFREFSLFPSEKCWDRISDYVMANFVHTLSYSLFTNDPLTWRRRVRVIESLVRWTKDNTDTYIIACKKQSGSHVVLTSIATGYVIRGVGCEDIPSCVTRMGSRTDEGRLWSSIPRVNSVRGLPWLLQRFSCTVATYSGDPWLDRHHDWFFVFVTL